METLQAASRASSLMGSSQKLNSFIATIKVVPKIHVSSNSLCQPWLQKQSLVGDHIKNSIVSSTTSQMESDSNSNINAIKLSNQVTMIAKMHVVMGAIADRIEMHNNIGAQRDNWNYLFLTSINGITLTASTMAAIGAIFAKSGAPFIALKLSSTLLYFSATVMLLVMNKIQPSQLAEEQRNSARLFKQLYAQIETMLSLRSPSNTDVNEAIDRVLALDKAYPLPLLGSMLEKFPKTVEPTVWWPKQKQSTEGYFRNIKNNGNGWNEKLEEEMREIVGILESKDLAEYMMLGLKALKLHRFLSVAGPVLTGLGALGCAFAGTSISHHGQVWAVMLGVISGALASIVNTVEHGGQVGMVFEMYRSNAGLFKLMGETIRSNLSEIDFERRENGEVFQMKVALLLGRNLSELKQLAAASKIGVACSCGDEFASKLF